MVVRPRRGRSNLGCLILLALIAGAIYVGVQFAQPYMRYYRFKDAVDQEMRFAAQKSNSAIASALRAEADSLELPPEAQVLSIQRQGDHITIESSWTERVALPGYARDLPFDLHMERDF